MRHHNGIDILPNRSDPRGWDVFAVADGLVRHATPNGARGFACYGMTVAIEHPQHSVHSLYAHLAEVSVSAGDTVRAGDRIGRIGATNGSVEYPGTTFADGRCLPGGRFNASARRPGADHLHFEIAARAFPMRSSVPRLDPIEQLERWGVRYTSRERGATPRVVSSVRANVSSPPEEEPGPEPESSPMPVEDTDTPFHTPRRRGGSAALAFVLVGLGVAFAATRR